MPNPFDQFDQPAQASGGRSNPFDQFDATPAAPAQPQSTDILNPSHPLYGQRHGGSVVTGLIDGLARAIKTPREVYEGKIDLNTDEGADRAGELALTGIGGAPSGLMRFAPRTAPATRPATEALRAADELGVSVPRGIATDNRALQAAFQRMRQVPGATKVVDQALDDFYGSVFTKADEIAAQAGGGAKRVPEEVGARIRQNLTDETSRIEAAQADEIARAQRMADEYQSGVQAEAQGQITAAERAVQEARQGLDALAPSAPPGTRAAVGDDLKTALEGRIKAHRDEQSKPYEVLKRTLISADRNIPVSPQVAQTLNEVMRARTSAGQGALPSDLMPLAELATRPQGASFNGLQRARNVLAERIEFEEANGFDAGDLKRAYSALTGAMENAVRLSARQGGAEVALARFRQAEQNFGARAETVAALRDALRNGPESLVDRMIGYASEKSGGNINKLRSLQKELPADEQTKVSRLAFQRLARDNSGEFSEPTLVRNWAAISPEGRAALFGANAAKIDQAIKSLASASQQVKFAREVGEASIKAAERDAKTNVRAATKEAAERARTQSRELLSLLAKSDEQIVNEALRWASQGAGADLQKLVRMSTLFGKENMDGLASIAIQRLGMGRNNEFSAAAFASGWKELSTGGKTLLFRDPQVRKALDNMAVITERMATVQKKFGNSSNTGGAVGMGALGAGLYADPFTTLAAVAGANGAARLLARPATAKAASEYAKVWQRYMLSPSPSTLAAVEKARARLLEITAKGGAIAMNDNERAAAAIGQ